MRFWTLSAIALIPSPALAQSDEIIVTGNALPVAKGDAAYSIVEVQAASASGQVEDAIKSVAGLTQFRRSDARSANATSQGATLRGLGGNASSRALLVLDGVPQSDPFGGWVTWPAYAPERLSNIRVTRGGGSGVYGSGALAGTIELSSVGVSDTTKVGALFGSRNSVEANALISRTLSAGGGFLSASYARGDGFIPIIVSQRGPVDVAAPYEQASLAARAVASLSGDAELQASALAFTDRRTRGTSLSQNGGDGADASLRLVHRGHWQWSALAYLQMRKFTSRFVAIDAARTNATQTTDQYNVPSTGIGARFEVRPPLGGMLEFRLGGDWRRTVGQTNELFTYAAGKPTRGREAGGSGNTLGGFAELSAKTGGLTLTGGGRVDHWSLGQGRLIERTLATGALIRNEIAAAREGWEPTARGGLAYQTGDITLRAAAYLGWRLPTLNELYRPFRVGADATAANPALNPERMRGTEVGFGWSHRYRAPIWENANDEECCVLGGGNMTGEASVHITAFTNRLTSAIANVSLGRGPGAFPGVGVVAAGGVYRQRLNIDAIQSRGVEIDGTARIGNWHAAASYAFTDARVRSSGLALSLSGLRPAQVPTHTASATLGWRWVSATARYVSTQFEDDANTRRLRGALTIDATANVPLGHELMLTLRGANLGNRQVDTAISATGVIERATPRTLWAGLRWGH
jgi:vitamin B12 transporter